MFEYLVTIKVRAVVTDEDCEPVSPSPRPSDSEVREFVTNMLREPDTGTVWIEGHEANLTLDFDSAELVSIEFAQDLLAQPASTQGTSE